MKKIRKVWPIFGIIKAINRNGLYVEQDLGISKQWLQISYSQRIKENQDSDIIKYD